MIKISRFNLWDLLFFMSAKNLEFQKYYQTLSNTSNNNSIGTMKLHQKGSYTIQ